MKSKLILVTNIQRFSLHDGPGIRTTVFLKGCSLRCPWCSNPENLKSFPEPYIKNNQKKIYGNYISCDDLYKEVMRDLDFYGGGGGVTYSGGEALLQMSALEGLMKRLKENGIHQCVETALFIPRNDLELAIKYLDFFYVDVKILDMRKCKEILHGDLALYLDNVDRLFRTDIPVVFRIPMIEPYTTARENILAMLAFVKKYRPLKVELIRGHNLGTAKYRSLGKEVPRIRELPQDLLWNLQMEIQTLGLDVETCEI